MRCRSRAQGCTQVVDRDEACASNDEPMKAAMAAARSLPPCASSARRQQFQYR
jgi:hypothetical protein